MNLAGLVAWSGDGRHALLSEGLGVAIEMDLTTGARHQISLPQLSLIGFTSPTGANLVAVQNVVAPDGTWTGQKLVRLDLNGRPQVQLAEVGHVSMRWLYSPEGATVYLHGPGGLRVASNAGGPIRDLATVEAHANCAPVAWWDQHTILTSCTENSGSRLWLAPVGVGSATPLTQLPGTEPVVDLGYDNAVRVGDAVFAEHLEACGMVTVHRLAPSGVGTRIAIPQSLSSHGLIGAVGGKIAVLSSTACGYPAWFGFYDPATNSTQKIVPDVPGELGAWAALAFP
jgi:TolB protein